MKNNFKGKWCINITKENVDLIKKHIRCGAGYFIDQTIFFNEDGINDYGDRNISWNVDRNNTCLRVIYPEIYIEDILQMNNTTLSYEIF